MFPVMPLLTMLLRLAKDASGFAANCENGLVEAVMKIMVLAEEEENKTGVEKLRSFALVAQARVQCCDLSSPQPPPPGFNLLSSWDYRHASPHLANFVFLVEIGLLHFGQAGLELPTPGDLPTLASQSAGITSAQPLHPAYDIIF
ncbi:Protein GVQW1 [Plecturocebus cupreus]